MTPLFPRTRLSLFGINLDNLKMDEALTAITEAVVTKSPKKIAFVNADCINISAKNRNYRTRLQAMDMVLVDGIGMRIAGKVLGQVIQENVNGTDLFPQLCARLNVLGSKLFLLGAKPGVAESVGQWVSSNYPHVEVVGTRHGYFSPSEEADVLEEIRKSNADVLLVAFGVPLQEDWIVQNMPQLGVSVAMGVGGLFDFYSGRIPRAPRVFRAYGLEWVYRLMQEPARMWRRYVIGNPLFLARMCVCWGQKVFLRRVL